MAADHYCERGECAVFTSNVLLNTATDS